jgi:serine/threonine protein kinase
MKANRQEQTSVANGRFTLRSPIGHGASAIVYAASDTWNRTDVAVKIPRTTLHGSPDVIDNGVHEASILRNVTHRAIVRWINDGKEHGIPFLAIERLSTRSLRSLSLARQPVAVSQVTTLLAPAASALAYIHRRGIAHGDVKPANLVFDTRSMLKLIDFGSAHRISESRWRCGSTTPAYAAPDLLYGATPTPVDDVYSLGVIVYELIAGQHPFNRAAPLSGQTPPPPEGLTHRAWDWLRASLSTERADRPDDPVGLIAALQSDTTTLARHLS